MKTQAKTVTVEDTNRIIAEFIECSNPFNEITDATLYKVSQGTFELSELKYHTSWDWLMPVVEKIYDKMESMPEDFLRRSRLHECLLDINLNNLYNFVVKFIKWYNNNLK